jgi:hypothetical protein
VNFDGKVRTAQLALHALDAILQTRDLDQEPIHLEHVLGAELDTDAASLAILFDDFYSCTAHSRLSPFLRNWLPVTVI